VRGDEGTHFLVAFQDLKNATEDSPDFLDAHWKDRDDLQQLCDRLDGYRRTFDIAEEWTPVAFTPHVPASASKARREYEERWQMIVSRIAGRELWLLFDELFPEGIDSDELAGDALGDDIEGWKNGARNEAGNITHAFSYLADRRSWDDDNDFEWVDEAQLSWDRLIKIVGLDLKGAFWRRNAIPHILFPSHVSNHYGPDRASIYRRLHDAARSFTFGAYLAALAMQRSVMEQLLEKHWNAERGHPSEANFHDQSQSSRAHRLWRLGNAALHREIDKLKNEELERELIKNFLLLRELIEGSPERARDD
jgi:hypothetical protein